MAEISTYNTKFEYGEQEQSLTPLRVKSFPEVAAKRSSIDVTDLQDDAKRYIPGIRDTPESLDFEANYDPTVMDTIDGLGDKEVFQQLTFSDGSGFKWKSRMSCALSEGNVDEAVTMTISSIPSTVPEHFITEP